MRGISTHNPYRLWNPITHSLLQAKPIHFGMMFLVHSYIYHVMKRPLHWLVLIFDSYRHKIKFYAFSSWYQLQLVDASCWCLRGARWIRLKSGTIRTPPVRPMAIPISSLVDLEATTSNSSTQSDSTRKKPNRKHWETGGGCFGCVSYPYSRQFRKSFLIDCVCVCVCSLIPNMLCTSFIEYMVVT
jgi:hypothetical protein